jgi:hypothetical protein
VTAYILVKKWIDTAAFTSITLMMPKSERIKDVTIKKTGLIIQRRLQRLSKHASEHMGLGCLWENYQVFVKQIHTT